jgi:hypothetical protein
MGHGGGGTRVVRRGTPVGLEVGPEAPTGQPPAQGGATGIQTLSMRQAYLRVGLSLQHMASRISTAKGSATLGQRTDY